MLYDIIDYDNQVIGQVDARDSIEAWAKARMEYGGVLDVRPATVESKANEKLKAIHDKWRELDNLQIATHFDCMSSRKWAVLNSLNAIGLELTKGYPAIGSYIDEKMETIQLALKDLRFDKEIIG